MRLHLLSSSRPRDDEKRKCWVYKALDVQGLCGVQKPDQNFSIPKTVVTDTNTYQLPTE